MDFFEVCQQRQSCRNFADRPVEHEKLVKCLEAARLTPSACNSQPWKFVVVEDPALVQEVAKCANQMGINEYAAGAKAFVVVLEEHAVLIPNLRKVFDSQFYAKGDLGAAVLTITMAAAAQGLGSLILGVYDREKIGKLLSLPPDQRYGGLIAIGYSNAEKTRSKVRKPLEEIARFV